MNLIRSPRICIIGAGLAGACAASFLAKHAPVTLLDAAAPGAGASGVAAGIANTFTGRRALPVWHREAARDALARTLEAAGCLPSSTGLFRPAADASQAARFRERATEHPDALSWLDGEACHALWPAVQASYGGLWISEGLAVDVGAFVHSLVVNAGIRTCFGSDGRLEDCAFQNGRFVTGNALADEADVVLLCTGACLPGVLTSLPLHRVKGQIIRLAAGPEINLPVMAGHGYLVPEGDTVLVGSTFEHVFEDAAPTPDGIALLRRQAAILAPSLGDAPLVEARAGIRTTVPGIRRPLLGPITRNGRAWVFNGLGARGLLTAPLLASQLWDYLQDPTTIPPEIRPPLLD